MHRIDTPNSIPNINGVGKRGFRNGDKVNGIAATELDADWCNAGQEELCNFIESQGIALNKADRTQLKQAIDKALSIRPSQPTAFNNLKLSANGTNALITCSADAISLRNLAGTLGMAVLGANVTINSAAVGANGLDAGVIAASTWYYLWIIYNPATDVIAGLASLSAVAPSLPAGYTFAARVGAFRTDGTANKYPLGFSQYGRRVQYKVASGSNVASLPVIATGIQGSITVPTWVSCSLAAFIPPTSSAVDATIHVYNSGTGVMVAPSAAYAAYGATVTPAPLMQTVGSGGVAQNLNASKLLPLETMSMYVASSDSAGSVSISGWEDNL